MTTIVPQLPWASLPDLRAAIQAGHPDAVEYARQAPLLYAGQPRDRAICARYLRDTRPPRRESAEVTRLRTEREQLAERVRELQGQLADALEAAEAAWDAKVAGQPCSQSRSRSTHAAGRRARLLLMPQSGARPLVGGVAAG